MLSQTCRQELLNSWLPNISDGGLDRLIDLLEKGSPLLIHGSFTRALPQGCLATHAAWNHPRTAHFHNDAGVQWMNNVVGINPATSYVIREWDAAGHCDFQIRSDLLELLKENRVARHTAKQPDVVERECELVGA